MALTTIDTYGIKDGAVQIDDIGTLAGNLTINDSGKLRLGTGLDLQLYHDASGGDSYINDVGVGSLILTTTSNSTVAIKSSAEYMAKFSTNAGVELYYDNTKKFETTSAGINIFGTTTCNSTINLHGELNLSGTPQDKYFDASITDGSTDYWMNFRAVRGDDASEHTVQMRYQNDGGVELNHNGTKKFETRSDGVLVSGNIQLNDSNRLDLGNNGDLKIYANGSNSLITHNGDGNLHIEATGSGEDLYLSAADIVYIRTNSSETAIRCVANGAVELYYDNSKKLETISTGVKIHGSLVPMDGNRDLGSSSLVWQDLHIGNDIHVADNGKIIFGAGDDLQIFHNGTNSHIENSTNSFYIKSDSFAFTAKSAFEQYITCAYNGAVTLYYDNSIKLHTASDGVSVTGVINNQHLRGGSGDMYVGNAAQGDLYIYVQDNTNNSIILQANTGEKYLEAAMGGAVDLYHHGSKKFETTSTGASMDGLLNFNGTGDKILLGDNGKIQFGGGLDFKLYHDGNNNLILGSPTVLIKNKDNNESYIRCNENAAVELYHDNGKRFETTSYGNASTGQVRVLNSGLANNNTTPAFSCGDAGTGIYRTGSNSLGYSANGTQKWAINSSGYLTLFDNVKLQIGSGEDIKIYHDGSHSYIKNGTGTLHIAAGSSQSVGFTNNAANAWIVRGIDGGAAELYYDASKKLDTNSNGVSIHGQLYVNGEINIDNGGDNAKYLDARLGSSVFWIRGTSGGDANHENMIGAQRNGRVELHYDATKKFETTSEGAKVHGHLRFDDSKYIKLGTGADVQMFHNGANFHIQHLTSGSTYMDSVGNHHFRNANGTEYRAKFTNNGSCELYYDAAIKFQTRTGGAYVYGKGGGTTFTAAQAMHASDRCGLEVQGELTGIKIASTYNDTSHPEYGLVFVQGPSTSSFNCWSISPDGPARGNNLRFHYQAQSSNIHVGTNCKVYMTGTGDWVPYTNNASDLGTSSHRWRNVYTNDLNLSNEGNTNDVDGTWGNYTIQEGEEDLFLLNRRNGKKYKFNLTEVS